MLKVKVTKVRCKRQRSEPRVVDEEVEAAAIMGVMPPHAAHEGRKHISLPALFLCGGRDGSDCVQDKHRTCTR